MKGLVWRVKGVNGEAFTKLFNRSSFPQDLHKFSPKRLGLFHRLIRVYDTLAISVDSDFFPLYSEVFSK